MKRELMATATFGLEACVKREIQALGYEIIGTENPVENFEKYVLPEKNRLRVEYALHQSFGLDAGLFFETIGGVFGKAKDMQAEHHQGSKEARHG